MTKKIFLDCGTNLGQGLSQFINNGIIDSNFEIHCFEPNPYAMKYTRHKFSAKKYKDYFFIFNEVALWIEESKKTLTIESFNGRYICQHTGEHLGYDLKSGGATNIMEDQWKKPDYIDTKDLDKNITVNCINFSDYLKKYINKKDYVICKMDIEGAEYEVLNKLINDKTIDLINEIYIEWHNHLLIKKYNTEIFIDEMQRKNIKIKNWI